MASGLHVSISAEPIFYIGDFAVTNSMFTSIIVSAAIIIFVLLASRKITNTRKPKGVQNFLEFIIEALLKLTNDITLSNNKTKLIFPITTTFFIFILLNNWAGLLPGVGTIGVVKPVHLTQEVRLATPIKAAAEINSDIEHTVSQESVTKAHDTTSDSASNGESHQEDSDEAGEHGVTFTPIFRAGTADLNTTLALSLISMTLVQIIGIKYLGLGYFKKFFNIKNPIFTFVGLLELISEFAKIISFAFRLFGNIFAGEVLLAVIAFLIPLIAPIPFLGLEIFVGVIQALVFMMLSVVFMSMATHAHES